MRAKKGFWNWQGQLSERKWKLFYNEIPANSTVYVKEKETEMMQKQNKKPKIRYSR